MKNLAVALILIFSLNSNALVTSPSAVQSGHWNVEIKSTLERGKVEPNENRSSYQSAEIDVHQLSVTKGLEAISFGSDPFIRLDLRYLKSGKEQVAGQTFYEADTGEAVSLVAGFNFVHESTHKAGLYFSVTPLANFNKDKFSVPRVDLWGAGFRSSIGLGDLFYVEDSLHYGAGIPGYQNSYIALTHLFGFKLDSWTGRAMSLKWGPYAELDTSERRDASYDAAFSPAGTQDRIRSMKIGVISSLEFAITNGTYGSVTYVQKLGGYDAPATNALAFAIGVNF